MNGPAGESLRSGVQLALAALLATALLAGVHWLTRDRILASDQAARSQALGIVLPRSMYDNALVADAVQVNAETWLGLESATVHRARLDGRDSALVLEASAPDGYNGPIRLLIAVDASGRVLGVRIGAHQETAGLGDAIDRARSDWSTRFAGRRLGDPPMERWAIRKDGGEFDQFAGATTTPRAVVQAVKRCLQFVARHGAEIHAAASGSTLRFDSAPDDADR